MLLLRFIVLILASIAAIVAVAVFDVWWAVVLAVWLVIALLVTTMLQISHFLSASGNRTTADKEMLEEAGFVDDDTGLPTRRRWNEHAAGMYADEVAENGTVPVPDDWQGPDAPRRVILVTTGPIDADRFVTEVLTGKDDPRDLGVLVIVPTLADRPMRFHVGNASEAAPHAEAVLDEVLDALRLAGVEASGHIGAADPAVAVSNGLRTYDADLVVVARHHDGDTRHLEDVPVEGAASAFQVPLREVDLSQPVG